MTFRPSRQTRVAFFITLFLLCTGPALRAETKTLPILDLLRALKVAPSTEAIALREGFVLHGIQTGAAGAQPQAGDQVTALVALGSVEGKAQPQQWIIRVQLAAKPVVDSTQDKSSHTTLYTNTGEKFTFHSGQSGMQLETLGPIKADTRPDQTLPIKRQNISAATDFLSLDLYRTALVVLRIKTAQGNPSLTLSTRPKPFPADEIEPQRPRAAALNLTPADQRSFSGSIPALTQFLDIVRNTPGLQDILFQVLDKPSVIDVLTHGSSNSLHFEFLGGGHSEGQEIFWPEDQHEDFGILFFNLNIFGKPVLTVALYLTTPHPPLLVSAGIVGLVAFSPSKPDKFVTVRVLSATAGENANEPAGTKP